MFETSKHIKIFNSLTSITDYAIFKTFFLTLEMCILNIQNIKAIKAKVKSN